MKLQASRYAPDPRCVARLEMVGIEQVLIDLAANEHEDPAFVSMKFRPGDAGMPHLQAYRDRIAARATG